MLFVNVVGFRRSSRRRRLQFANVAIVTHSPRANGRLLPVCAENTGACVRSLHSIEVPEARETHTDTQRQRAVA